MKTIPLKDGRVVIVDDDDYEELAKFHWFADSNGYAKRYMPRVEGKQMAVKMHRQIMCMTPGNGLELDHINMDRLDNSQHPAIDFKRDSPEQITLKIARRAALQPSTQEVSK